MTRVAVVGAGLIGGSLALAMRAHAFSDPVVVDRASVISRPEVVALSHARVDAADRAAYARALANAELVVLALPVAVIAAEMEFVLEHSQIVTDCGSTKRTVVRAAASSPGASRFVPGHPLAGGTAAGAAGARAELFEQRRWVLCPEGRDPEAVRVVESMVRAVGAEPVRLSAEEHDRAVARTSHLAQLVASALCVLGEEVPAEARGPGFESTTRVAGGNPEIWRDILASNADAVAAAARLLGDELIAVAEALERTPPSVDAALRLIEAARKLRAP
jgi:prephenate dehydrogenase